jgi:probable F420-dependent oxidoreductase
MKIGYVIDHVQDEATGRIPSYTELKAMAQTAEAGGLDSIWVFDHLLFRYQPENTVGIWECWTLLCALAEATESVELGTLVLCNPFRNPALLAKMAHTLDEISDGRLILGIGAGWHEPEFDAFGFPFDHRVGRLEEALQILQPLLKGKTVDFEGEYYQAKNCVVTPAGPRPDGIPLLMGAFGPRMLRLTAEYADMWNTVWHGDVAGTTERVAQVKAACEKAGRDPATLTITAGLSVAYPDLGDARPFAREPLGGSAAEVAAAFAAYEAAGISHLIVQATPTGPESLARLLEAVAAYRG